MNDSAVFEVDLGLLGQPHHAFLREALGSAPVFLGVADEQVERAGGKRGRWQVGSEQRLELGRIQHVRIVPRCLDGLGQIVRLGLLFSREHRTGELADRLPIGAVDLQIVLGARSGHE